jgi:hypothetical protein
LLVPLLDADGDPVSPSSPDTEISQDCGTFADATNEATELATSSGFVYVDLISTEMDTKSTVVQVKSTGAKTTFAVLNPRRLPIIRTGTAQAGANSTITLDSSASARDDFYEGCFVKISNDTPTNALGQARKIVGYVGSTKVATIEGTWGTNPSSSSTFEILATPEATCIVAVGGTALVSSVAGQLDANVTHYGGTAGTFASGIPQASLTTSAINSIADQVWDEATSGHVAAGSFGANLQTMDSGTAQAGAATSITLQSGASATTDYYKNDLVVIVSGTGAKQGRFISAYNGTTKVATVPTWATNPDNTSVYTVLPFAAIAGATAPTATENADAVWGALLSTYNSANTFGEYFNSRRLRRNTAQSGTTSSITLDASASATNNQYRYAFVSVLSGTGSGQSSRQITAYNGSSKAATVAPDWTTAPDNTSVFFIEPFGLDAATVALIASAVWEETRAGHATAGSFGEYVNADAVRISGDATSADNLESYTDGTTPMPVNATQISGDATAADNLEAALDGTGGVTISAGLTGAITGNITGNLSGSVGSVTGAVGSVTGAVASVTGNVGGNVTGTVGSLAAQAKADVNAEVLDVLNTDTFAEPGQEAPPATTTLIKKIGYLYKMLRNKKTQTATTFSLFADDGSTVDQKATVSDSAGTTTHGEIGSGP